MTVFSTATLIRFFYRLARSLQPGESLTAARSEDGSLRAVLTFSSEAPRTTSGETSTSSREEKADSNGP